MLDLKLTLRIKNVRLTVDAGNNLDLINFVLAKQAK